MTKYINDTIAALDLKIGLLQQTRRTLESTFENWTIEAEPDNREAPAPAPVNGHPRPGMPARAARAARKHGGRGAGWKLLSAKREAAAAKLAEPFGTSDLAKAAGSDLKHAGGQICRWVRAGFLKTVGYGKYERTAKFPKAEAAGAQARVAIPGLDPEPAKSIQEQLEKALKDRDEARAAGHDKLAKILQDKVALLEAKL